MNNKEQLIQQLVKHELRRSKTYNSQPREDKEYLNQFEKYTEEKLPELCQIDTEEEEERKRDEQLEWERRELREYYQRPLLDDTLLDDIVVQYSKRSLWKLEEAVALVLGILPELGLWNRIKHHHNGIHNLPVPDEFYISWIEDYYVLMILTQRAIEAGELEVHRETNESICYSSYLFKPIDFIQWAQKKEIPLPTGMEHLVKKYTVSYVDWESKCKELESTTTALKAQNDELKEMLEPLHGGEKSAYQKMIFILVYNGYGLKNFEDQPLYEKLQELLKDTQSLRDNADLKLPFKLPCNKTITKHYNTIKELFQKSR